MEVFRRLLIAPGKIVIAISLLQAFCHISVLPGCAQEYYSNSSKMDDPNLKHFYMGRQEIEIFDNSPIVRYRGSTAPGQTGAVPGGPQPLPAAGFQQYSSNVNGRPLNLPKVENGVPRKVVTPQSSLKGSAAKLKTTKATQQVSHKATASSIKTYKQTYQTRAQSALPAAGLGSSQKVHGKLLPFATTRKRLSY